MASRKKDSQLEPKILELVEPHTAGDPMSSRKWLNCRLSDAQARLGKHRVSKPVSSRILKARNYRLRGNVKEICSERNAQFEHIQAQRQEHQEAGEHRHQEEGMERQLQK